MIDKPGLSDQSAFQRRGQGLVREVSRRDALCSLKLLRYMKRSRGHYFGSPGNSNHSGQLQISSEAWGVKVGGTGGGLRERERRERREGGEQDTFGEGSIRRKKGCEKLCSERRKNRFFPRSAWIFRRSYAEREKPEVEPEWEPFKLKNPGNGTDVKGSGSCVFFYRRDSNERRN
ncbi:hypothetical protein WMY93_023373 [Mugilogobius chulae]|uniref:Uncharacterized protein n=1 Tax=Mugilogobius chulae TaxID=88201 RepID=A0AAW0N8H9_9GOBI